MPETILRVDLHSLQSLRVRRDDGTVVEATIRQLAEQSRLAGLEQPEQRATLEAVAAALYRLQSEQPGLKLELIIPLQP